MPIQHGLWVVGIPPARVEISTLISEEFLEDMIVADPRILSDEWMLIGRQEDTGTGGQIDLLAIAPDTSLILIELKKNKTSREVIAQTLDYAHWIAKLETEEIAEIYKRFKGDENASLSQDFRDYFGHNLDEKAINDTHQLVVVASSVDPRTERIIEYLDGWDIPINMLSFEIFQHGDTQYMSRSWFLDPREVQINASTSSRGKKEPWNGEFYASFGHDGHRDWEEAVKYGFISAGGGAWYSTTLDLLCKGARVWVKAPNHGFVGVGRVTGSRQSATEFEIDGKPALEVLTEADYHRDRNDIQQMEYFVPVKWLDTVPLERAIHEIGMFGNQNTVCRPVVPKWRTTVDELKKVFPQYDSDHFQSKREEKTQ